jgi:uncharacterized protein (DUF1778 family)
MATQSPVLEKRTEKLDVRVSPTAKSKLQAAAAVTHRTVSDFVLESALSRAEETLADRRVFVLDDEKWEAFLAALDAPPRPMPRMRKLLEEQGYLGSDFHLKASDPTGETISFDSIMEIERAGFEGFLTISRLKASNCAEVPDEPGVYMVLRPDLSSPEFLSEGTGGFFKGKNPNVPIDKLEGKWIDSSTVTYIGMSGDQSDETLRSRWKKRLRFGNGRPVGARGGRYIWQLKNVDQLIVCWKTMPDVVPQAVKSAEKELLRQFRSSHEGKLPFANLR